MDNQPRRFEIINIETWENPEHARLTVNKDRITLKVSSFAMNEFLDRVKKASLTIGNNIGCPKYTMRGVFYKGGIIMESRNRRNKKLRKAIWFDWNGRIREFD